MKVEFMKATNQKHFFDLMQLRVNVFLIEQQVDASIEIDEYDKDCYHFIAYNQGIAVATCRLVIKENFGKIGRVCVNKEYRHLKIGSQLLNFVEQSLEAEKIDFLILGSQVKAQAFYETLGYKSFGEIFLDADIEHIMMRKDLTHE